MLKQEVQQHRLCNILGKLESLVIQIKRKNVLETFNNVNEDWLHQITLRK